MLWSKRAYEGAGRSDGSASDSVTTPRRWEAVRRALSPGARALAARETLHDLARQAAKSAVPVMYGAQGAQRNDAAAIRDEIARRLCTRTARSALRGAA